MAKATETPHSIGLIEVGSIALGYAVADALVKAADVQLLEIAPVSPGKLYILYSGDVAALEIAHAAGLRMAGGDLIAELRLAQAHPQIFTAVRQPGWRSVGEALGILECSTVAAGVLAADAAAKAADVDLIEIRRAAGIGGKTTILLTGTTANVQIGLVAGRERAEAGGAAVRAVEISGVHEDLRKALAERWQAEGRAVDGSHGSPAQIDPT